MTLKEKLEIVKQEFRNRIINGEFEVLSAYTHEMIGYLGTIRISIDDVSFSMALSEKGDFISIHEGLELNFGYNAKKELKNLYKAFHKNLDRSKEIKILEEKLKQLKS